MVKVLTMLSNPLVDQAIKKKLAGDSSHYKFIQGGDDHLVCTEPNLFVQTTPLETTNEEITGLIKNRKPGQHLIIPIVGEGSTELHIAILYVDNEGNKTVFDSKLSDPQRFLSSSSRPDSPVQNSLQALGRSLFNWRYSKELHLDGVQEDLKDVRYEGLGTQSLLDGDTCGYHVIGHVYLFADMIAKREAIRRDSLMQKIDEGYNPVEEGYQLVRNFLPNIDLNTVDKIKSWVPTSTLGKIFRTIALAFTIPIIALKDAVVAKFENKTTVSDIDNSILDWPEEEDEPDSTSKATSQLGGVGVIRQESNKEQLKEKHSTPLKAVSSSNSVIEEDDEGLRKTPKIDQ